MIDAASFRRPLAGRLAPDQGPVVAFLPDPRADGRRRRVEFTPARILIERSVAGVAMKLQLAPAAYRGVALGVVVEDGLPAYEVALVHPDAELSARLALADRESDALAALDHWAAWFGLPKLIEGVDGALIAMDAARAPRRSHRRVEPARGRRPRFLVRRKPGSVARMAIVHEGEREIVCYE